MNERRLLVLDAYDIDALTANLNQDQGAWDVLLLGLSEAWFRCLTPRLPQAGERVHFIDPHVLAPQAHERLRTFASQTLGSLAEGAIDGKPLERILADELDTSWWYTETSEQGPYRTPLVYQLYQLALLEQAIEMTRCAEVVVVSAQRWLCRVVSAVRTPRIQTRLVPLTEEADERGSLARRYWRQAIGAVATVLLVRAGAAAGQWPRVHPVEDGLAIFTFYPAWWAASETSGARERFFSDLRPDAWFLCWLRASSRLWTARNTIRRLIATRRMVLLQRFVPWTAILKTLSLSRFRSTMALLRRLPAALSLPFAGVDVGPLVVADLERSLTSGERFQDELLDDAVAGVARQYRPRNVLYRAEFQPAERALLAGLCGTARALGFVHYPYGRNYLPVWVEKQPLADGMLTCGEVGHRHLVERGYPFDRVAECGPQRHATLITRLASPRDRPQLRRALGVTDAIPVFFVGIAIVEADSEALFGALGEALRGFGPYRLRIRTHPNRPTGDRALECALEMFGAERAGVVPDSDDLYDAIEASDAMIIIGSTLAFEGMALGCMPVVFENPSTFAANTLRAFSDALYVVHDAGSLRLALDQICAGAAEAGQKRARWSDAVRSMLGDLRTPLPEQLARAVDELELAASGGRGLRARIPS